MSERKTLNIEGYGDVPCFYEKVHQRARSVSGYGPKEPTDYKVRLKGATLRVYCAIYGNIGSCYVMFRGKRLVVSD